MASQWRTWQRSDGDNTSTLEFNTDWRTKKGTKPKIPLAIFTCFRRTTIPISSIRRIGRTYSPCSIPTKALVLAAANAQGLDLKLSELVRSRWDDAVKTIGAEHDIAEIVRLVDPGFSGGGWHGGGDSVGSGTSE